VFRQTQSQCRFTGIGRLQLHEIGWALGKDHVVIHFLLARHGGIGPPIRCRSWLALTLADREDISRGIASACSIREIVKHLI